MVKIKLAFILSLLMVFLLRFYTSNFCLDFKGFYFNSLQIKLTVESQREIDSNLINNIAPKIFHNKLSVGIFEVFKAYSKAFDPYILVEILSPVGVLMLFLSALNLKKLITLQIIHLLIALSIILLAIFQGNSKFSYFMVFFSLSSFSLWGFLNKKGDIKFIFIFLVLFLYSIWFILFKWQMEAFCGAVKYQ